MLAVSFLRSDEVVRTRDAELLNFGTRENWRFLWCKPLSRKNRLKGWVVAHAVQIDIFEGPNSDALYHDFSYRLRLFYMTDVFTSAFEIDCVSFCMCATCPRLVEYMESQAFLKIRQVRVSSPRAQIASTSTINRYKAYFSSNFSGIRKNCI